MPEVNEVTCHDGSYRIDSSEGSNDVLGVGEFIASFFPPSQYWGGGSSIGLENYPIWLLHTVKGNH